MSTPVLHPSRGSSPNRLLIPARRIQGREVLIPVAPFFLRDTHLMPQESAPRLLSFESDGFMDDFRAVAGGTAPLPRLLPWRDWSEPPEAMLDPSGAETYPSSVARRPPETHEIEPESSGVESDGVPRDPAAGPPWLRKLYLPLHGRFHLVAFDLICRSPGWPPLARGRVKGSGAVIRRLARNRVRETWQDWIAVDEQQGAWLSLLDERMRPATAPPAPREHLGVDPAALPVADLDPAGQTALQVLFAVPVGGALPRVALTSATLNLVPPDAGEADRHCTLFGYLPLFSSAKELVRPRLSEQPLAAIAGALAAQSAGALDSLFSETPALQARAAPHLRELLEAALLPQRPADPAAARNQILVYVAPGSPPPFSPPADPGAAADLMVDRLLRLALHRLLVHDGDAGVVNAAIAGQVPDPQTFWTQSQADTVALTPGLSGGWLGANLVHLPSQWDILVRERLHQAVHLWIAGTWGGPALPGAGPLSTLDLRALTALAVLRLRACRLALAAYLGRAAGLGLEDSRFRARDEQGNPLCTAAALADEVSTILGAESARGDPRATPPWPTLSTAGLSGYTRLKQAHDAAQSLTEVYADFDARLGTAGVAAARRLADTEVSVATALAGVLDSAGTPLRHYGLSLTEQPARALLVLPGWGSSAADLMAFRNQASALYTAAPESLALPEARTRERAPRLRFDADHLYAVWCWVRVAGHSPCEPDRVLWTGRTEPFAIADPTDLLGAQPAVVKMPDIPKLLKDLPRLAKARARPFAAVAAPDRSGIIPGAEMADTRRDWGIGMICSFGIPVITICALVLFSIIFHILILIPGFTWMLLLKFCIPFPKRSS